LQLNSEQQSTNCTIAAAQLANYILLHVYLGATATPSSELCEHKKNFTCH